MSIGDFVPASDAAERLCVSQARIRALIAAGALDGQKVGGRWFVGVDGIRRRELWGPVGGRPLEPENAWGILVLGSGALPAWLPDDDLRRLARLLDRRGLLHLAPRMGRRATTHRFYGHPGILQALAIAPEVRLTGISAARENGFGIVGGQQVDAYVALTALAPVVARFALEPRSAAGNVSLRTHPLELAFPGDPRTPPAAVALDLAETGDTRSAETGMAALQRLDEERRWHAVISQ